MNDEKVIATAVFKQQADDVSNPTEADIFVGEARPDERQAIRRGSASQADLRMRSTQATVGGGKFTVTHQQMLATQSGFNISTEPGSVAQHRVLMQNNSMQAVIPVHAMRGSLNLINRKNHMLKIIEGNKVSDSLIRHS